MFVISKLFTYLVLPPGIFVTVLVLAGFYAKRFKKLFFFSAFFLYLLSTKFVANMLLYPLEYAKFKNSDTAVNAVVVLGGGVNKNDVLKAYPDAFKREIYGILLAKKHNIPFVFTGGYIKKYKEAEGIKEDIELISKIFDANLTAYFEEKSLNTFENAKLSAKLFDDLNMTKNIYLVTSAYHMKRSYMLFKNFGFDVTAKPVGYFYDDDYTVWDFFPKMGDLFHSYKAIHEYCGLLKDMLKLLLHT